MDWVRTGGGQLRAITPYFMTSWVEGVLFAEIQDIRREVACWGNNELFNCGGGHSLLAHLTSILHAF